MTENWRITAERQRRSLDALTRPKVSAKELERRRIKAEMLVRTRERRTFAMSENFEMREAKGGVLRFSGYASVTDQPYEVGRFVEVIRPGAFRRTLSQDPDVQLLINHGDGGSGMPIARTGRNMTLTEDKRGLRVDAELDPEDPDVLLLARKMKNGLIDQMSFAFQVAAGDQDWNDDYSERIIRAVNIHRGDVSIVNQGASETTVATIRSRSGAKSRRTRSGASTPALQRRRRERQEAFARALKKGRKE